MTKKLTSLEYERMESTRLKRELRSKELLLLSQKAERINDKQHILELMIKTLELERRQVLDDKQTVQANLAKEKQENEELLNGIKKRLKISGKFGYNPDTLEIVEE